MFKLQRLETAKTNILKIRRKLGQKQNLATLAFVQQKESGNNDIGTKISRKDYSKTIFSCHSDTVDVFNAVEHNLNENNAKNIRSVIDECQQFLEGYVLRNEKPTVDQFDLLFDLPKKLETMIGKEIKNLQTEMTD